MPKVSKRGEVQVRSLSSIAVRLGGSKVEEVTSEKSKYNSPVYEYRVKRKREIDLAMNDLRKPSEAG